jgi:FtsH-binding integral membrane protein
MLPTIIRRVFAGYAAVLKPVGFVIALLAVSAALSFAIAWPLWYFATSQRVVYSIFTLAVIAAAGVALFMSSRARKAASGNGPTPPNARKHRAAFGFFIVSWICILAGGAYVSILLIARGRTYLGALILAALIVLLGLAAWYARRKN